MVWVANARGYGVGTCVIVFRNKKAASLEMATGYPWGCHQTCPG